MSKKLKNTHPGEILKTEFLKPMKISESQLAKGIGVHPHKIKQITEEKKGITVDLAIRFSKFFGNSFAFWKSLQIDHEIEKCQIVHGCEYKKIKKFV